MYLKIISPLLACFIAFGSITSVSAATASKNNVNAVKELKSRGEIDTIKCDKISEVTAKLGDTFSFYVDLETKSAAKIQDIKYWFWADKDYNTSDAIFELIPTKEIQEANWIVNNKKIRLVESTDYKINVLPDKSSKENIIFKAEIVFNEAMSDGSFSNETGHVFQCVRVKVVK